MNSTTQLIPVFNGELDGRSQQLCDARDLHRCLAVGRHFSNWIKDRIEHYGLVEGYDFTKCASQSERGEGGRGGRNRIDYHLCLDAAKGLAMIENNELGHQVRRYFIAMEKAVRNDEEARADITPGQSIALHKQVTSLMKAIRTERSEAISEVLYAQIKQLCGALSIPAPTYLALACPDIRKGGLFLVPKENK